MADVIERMRTESIGTVFVQPQFSREAAMTVARETGARIRLLDPLGRDPLQSLVEPGAAVAEAMAP